QPFFAYLSFNAPHTPLQLPGEYYDMYKDLEFDAAEFEVYDEIVEKMTRSEIEAARRVYGMVSNIDDNIGRLMLTLKELGIQKNTLIVFLTDNGPQHNRYKMGLRERKSSVFGGGVRVPCLIHYPAKFKKRSELNADFAHIDLLPSILDLCGLDHVSHQIDGLSIFSPDDKDHSAFEERTLFFEWGRGFLQKYRNFAALKEGFKLVGNTGRESKIEDFELYDIKNDAQEKNNILALNLDRASMLKTEIDQWYDEIINEENNNKNFPSYAGTPFENPVILNRNDAKGTPVAWTEEGRLNYWDVRVVEEGIYDITYYFVNPLEGPAKVSLNLYPYNIDENCKQAGTKDWTFKNVKIKEGDYHLEPYIQTGQGKYVFPMYVTITRVDQ
ncbi:MAG: sulfatase-like hydrolase/transferase, partial [Bacteroides sp.]|nr:sulfatase-like hydrolase/transferase [Bacteroides sp.]